MLPSGYHKSDSTPECETYIYRYKDTNNAKSEETAHNNEQQSDMDGIQQTTKQQPIHISTENNKNNDGEIPIELFAWTAASTLRLAF